MKHLGDITKISGRTAPIVDCIIGGSPCQDLSMAGKRAGLDGERSGLYMEQIRIVKEMRAEDEARGRTGVDIRPRYMVWENVPGAFSSNKGEDFRIVLEEIAKVCDKDAVIPRPEDGKWRTSGCVVGDGWSVAWRVLDAQFWGTSDKPLPQRRRRIALVADFGGQSAQEILFVRKSVSGNIEPSEPKREGTSSNAQGSVGVCDCVGIDGYNAQLTGDKTSTLGVNCGLATGRTGVLKVHILQDPTAVYSVENHPNDSRVSINEDGKVQALTSRMGTGGGNVPMVLALDRASFNQGKNAQFDFEVSDKGVNSPLVAKGPSAVCYKKTRYIVRRLTPLECERLQGYPSELKLDVSKMTKDEYIAYNILEGNIIVDAEAGKVYRTRGPGGATLDKPQEMKGSDCNGYLVVKISNGTTKMICRVHRIVWISQHGVIPDGYCIDHINSDKKDNRISNLQLLTPQENSSKAAQDGLYATGEDNGATKISADLWDEIAYLHHCEGKTMRQLAEIYGISKSRIQQIVKEVGWTDIGEYIDTNGKTRQTSDAARYKALGNSIALPPWKWVLKRLCACYERDATMTSLFDGIGGFPYLWEQLNGKGTCLWASEIEEFPIAVTKVRIGE